MSTYNIKKGGVNFTVDDQVVSINMRPGKLEVWKVAATSVGGEVIKIDPPVAAQFTVDDLTKITTPLGLNLQEVVTLLAAFLSNSLPVPAEATEVILTNLPDTIAFRLAALLQQETDLKGVIATTQADLEVAQAKLASVLQSTTDQSAVVDTLNQTIDTLNAELTSLNQKVVDLDAQAVAKQQTVDTLDQAIVDKSNESTRLSLNPAVVSSLTEVGNQSP